MAVTGWKREVELTNVIEAVIAGLAGAGSAFAIAIYAGQRLIEHRLSRSADRFRAELTERTEALKIQLGIHAHEHQIALSRVDAQRSAAIHAVYVALRAWAHPTTAIIAGCPFMNADGCEEYRFYKEHAEEAHSAGKQLLDTLADNAIFLPTDIYTRIVGVVTPSVRLTASFLKPIREAEAQDVDGPDLLLEPLRKRRERMQTVYEGRIQPLLQDVVMEFRRLLHVESAVHTK